DPATIGLQFDRMFINQFGTAGENLDMRVLKAFGIKALQPGDLLILGIYQLFPVECGSTNLPAVTGCILKMFRKLGSIDEKLLGYAATNNAGSAHTVFFCKTDLFPHRSGQAPSPDTAGTAADNKKIIVEAGHGSLQSILHWPICRQNKKPGQVTGLLNSALPSEITAVRAAPEPQQRQPVLP